MVKVSNTECVPYKIQNSLVTTPDSNVDLIYTSIEGNKYIISGTLNKSNKLLAIGAVTNDYFNNVRLTLEYLLQKHNIKLNGKILAGKLPDNAEIMAMKKSDNFVTDYVLAEASTVNNELCREIANRQMEWRDAGRLLKKLVKKHIGVDITSSLFEDGSGISRVNVLTVSQFDKILQAVSKKSNFSEILTMLAVPGEEGSLKNRFSNNVKAKIYAKTGSLTGVVSLIGYFYDPKGELHSFVIVINNIYGSVAKFRKLEDDIVSLFLE
ncbi:MAG: D-alanyl-D-alanine carboxypeptidase/D-alanyl-D-alanine-endopeptidase [Rickettsiaceae bacterium]